MASNASLKAQASKPANYALLASSYAFWEYLLFGTQLHRCRQAHSDELIHCREVLLLGDGDGRFSTPLLEANQDLQITSLDASGAFLKQAKLRRKKRRIPENRIRTLQENVLEWSGEKNSYDAVVAQYFFDSFNQDQLRLIAEKIHHCLKPNGKLLVSDFHIPTDTRLGNWRARIMIGFLYALFSILTGLQTKQLPDWMGELESKGFTLKNAIYFSQKSLVSQLFQKGPQTH